MTTEILGRREDQRLEFKSREVLAQDPSQIARAVVGTLNAEGGKIWIGVEEEGSVAVAVEPVRDAERQKERLRDYLLDVLDPTPLPDEVSIDLEPPGAEPAVLVVTVQPAEDREERRPYAFRKAGGWHFLRRVGARNHPMSRQEIFGWRVKGRGDEAVEGALRELEDARQACRDRGESGLWVGFQPVPRLELDPENPLFDQIVLDPAVTGNRRSGWHFARSSNAPQPTKDGIRWALRSELLGKDATLVHVTESGVLRFWVALERLHRKGEEREIWPLILLEYPISAFRIARVIYADRLHSEDPVAANLALFGVGGWMLREGSPGDFFFGNDLSSPLEEPDLIWEPEVFRFREIDEAPDRCGFRLVRRVYRAFGWRERDMPQQYDAETGKLILPE